MPSSWRLDKISRLDGEAKTARANLEQARTNLASVQSQLGTANQILATARTRIEQGKVALAKNESLLKKNQELLASKQSKLAEVGSKLESAKANYAALLKNYRSVDALRVQANEEVTNLREQRNTLSGVVERLRADYAQLTKDRDTARAELATARADLHQGVLELDEVRASLDEARQNLKQAQIDAASYKFAASSSRAEPIIYQKGQEVQRLALPAHLSPRQAQQAWDRLMSSTSKAAGDHGAQPQAGSSSCVFLPNWRPNDPNIPEASPAEQQQAILERITGQDQEIVLIAQASINTFRGESVPLTLVGLPNPIVYHKGEVLAELHVGRHWQGSQALVEFNDFMQQKVQEKIKSKMIPVAGQPNSLIDIAPAKTLEVVEELSRAPRESVLQVSCHAETRAGDSLQLDFRFK